MIMVNVVVPQQEATAAAPRTEYTYNNQTYNGDFNGYSNNSGVTAANVGPPPTGGQVRETLGTKSST
jgi:hypothetical protein